MAEAAQTETANYLDRLLSSMRIDSSPGDHVPMIRDDLKTVAENVSTEDRFLSSVAALFYNLDADQGRFDKGKVLDLASRIDVMVNDQLNEILHHERFQEMEAAWRGLDDLVSHTNFRANVAIDILDVAKDELHDDFENNSSNVFGGALFQKVYIAEYDQYGGRPFGAMLGMFEFDHTPKDLFWLRNMAKIANASHAPFISSVSPRFFGCQSIEEVEAIKDLEAIMAQPRYGSWNAFRDSEEAAYVGLTFPRYVLRLPWDPEKNPATGVNFTEVALGERSKYLWGNAAVLFARNLIQSFERNGWCQYIRGPKGGGLVSGLPVDTFHLHGQDEIRPPVEVAIPDYRELEFARCGFIPLVYRKSSSDATFFSAQAVKRTNRFKDAKDSENSQLVANMAYTFSVTRIAHYVKSIMRDNIGSAADEAYIQSILQTWLMGYVTTVVNPDDLTLRYFPFKAAQVAVQKRPGELGWYDCSIAIMPHVQFEGMSVELRLESRLGSA